MTRFLNKKSMRILKINELFWNLYNVQITVLAWYKDPKNTQMQSKKNYQIRKLW